eukprot:2622947-Rhodomonas_salina.1
MTYRLGDYATPCTDEGCFATHARCYVRYWRTLLCYALALPGPVLSFAMMLRTRYWESGTAVLTQAKLLPGRSIQGNLRRDAEAVGRSGHFTTPRNQMQIARSPFSLCQEWL